jgi:hypothetical protein
MTGSASDGAASDVAIERLVSERSGRIGGERRQHIVSFVESRDRSVTVDEIADAVVDWETDHGLNSDWTEIRLHLHEVDLPMLDDAGLVSFSPEEGIVSARREPPGAWRDEAARVRLSTVARLVVTVGGVGVAFAAGVAVPDPAPFRSAWLVWSVTAIATLAACVYLSSSSLRSAR